MLPVDDLFVLTVQVIIPIPTIFDVNAGTRVNNIIRWPRSDEKVGSIPKRFMCKTSDNSTLQYCSSTIVSAQQVISPLKVCSII